MLRGIIVFMLAGVIGLLAGGNALAAKPRLEASQSSSTANQKTSTNQKTVKKKTKLKAAKGTVHVHVLNKSGKSATRATVTIKSGHHKVVRRANRAGSATISIAGHKSATVKAHNNHGAHGSVHTAIKAGAHSSVTVSLRGGRAASPALTTGHHHHKRHHPHQSKNLGTRSSHAAKKTAAIAPVQPAPAAEVI